MAIETTQDKETVVKYHNYAIYLCDVWPLTGGGVGGGGAEEGAESLAYDLTSAMVGTDNKLQM